MMSAAADPIIRRLDALARDFPELEEAARLYGVFLPILRDADPRVAPLPLTPEQVRMKLAQGVPLLAGLDLELDGRATEEVLLRLARALETIGETAPGTSSPVDAALAENAGRIRAAVSEEKLDIGALLRHVAAGEGDQAASMAQELGLEPDLMGVLAQNALKPALHAWRRQLAPLAEGIAWESGDCFVCGAAATMGELRDSEQSRHLRCGQCGADWLMARLRCARCGSEDHAAQCYLYAEHRHGRMRVEVCDVCHGYLKIIAAFDPTPPEMLPVEDLATLHLDYIARKHGYAWPAATDKEAP